MFDTELKSTTMFRNCFQAHVGKQQGVIGVQMVVNGELVDDFDYVFRVYNKLFRA